jgi:hypothetical protein
MLNPLVANVKPDMVYPPSQFPALDKPDIQRFRQFFSANSSTDDDRLRQKFGDFVANDFELHRFLEARDRDHVKARDLLRSHLQWREDYRLDTIMDEDFSQIEAIHLMYATVYRRADELPSLHRRQLLHDIEALVAPSAAKCVAPSNARLHLFTHEDARGRTRTHDTPHSLHIWLHCPHHRALSHSTSDSELLQPCVLSPPISHITIHTPPLSPPHTRYFHGECKEGNPCFIWRAGEHDPKQFAPDVYTRYLVYCIVR